MLVQYYLNLFLTRVISVKVIGSGRYSGGSDISLPL